MTERKIMEITDLADVSVGDLWVRNDQAGGQLMYTDDKWETQPPVKTEAERRVDRMEAMLEKILERLSILEDPTPEQLEKHKTLKEAYEKYKFIEGLCGKVEASDG